MVVKIGLNRPVRIQPGKIINQVANGGEVTVTFRGKALAKIIPVKRRAYTNEKEDISIFGLWKDHEDTKKVEDYVRELRKRRPPVCLVPAVGLFTLALFSKLSNL